MGLPLTSEAAQSGASVEDPRWREADERLLDRLGDERAVTFLWRSEVPASAPDLPRRAAVLAREARKLPGGMDAVRRAEEGDVAAFAALVHGPMIEMSPAMLHAAAIYFQRLAELPSGRDGSPSQVRAKIVEANIHAMAAWLALVEEKTFLLTVARKIAAGSLSDAEVDAEALGSADRLLDNLARIASKGAKDLTWEAALALAALSWAHDAPRVAGVSGAQASKFTARADRNRARVIDEALFGVEDAVAEARARAAEARELAALFGRVREVWLWSDRDEAVERFAVDQITNVAWDIYRTGAWAALRELLAPCEALYDSLEARLLSRPGDIAYSAKAAQILVFRSESQTEPSKEWLLAERALKVCPSHRNGKLIMAQLLSDQAIKTLARSTIFTGRNDVRDMTPMVERAEALFPQSKRTQEARAKLDEARVRWGAAPK